MERVRRTKIIDALKLEDFGRQINVKGWVRTRRGSKNVGFIALNDGSTLHNIQIVVDIEKMDPEVMKQITTGSCISVIGEVVPSQGKGQKVELQAREIYGVSAGNSSSASADEYFRGCFPNSS